MFISRRTYNAMKDEIKELRDKVTHLNAETFREGDCVYINDGQRDPLKEYYLITAYGSLAGPAFMVDTNKDIHPGALNEHRHGVPVKYMSKEPPEQCGCCGHVLEDHDE